MNFSTVDYGIVGVYLLIVFWLGLIKTQHTDSDHYLLAGRKITLPAFVASLVSTWYGGILGVGEFTYLYGISNWFVFGLPYYLFGLLFAFFLARQARKTKLYTIPDQLEKSYGPRSRVLGAAYIFLLASPAPYLLMLGVLITLFIPIPLWVAICCAAGFSLVYIYRGGMESVVRTDVLQFALMFAGFAVLVFVAWQHYGGVDFLRENIPAAHFSWHGGNSLQYILVWYIIASATLVDANFFQRCFAAKSESIAKHGILISIIFWFLFDLLTTTAGLYARAILPELDEPSASFPRLAATILPDVLRGLFFVALLATIMSTLDSFGFVSGVTLGRDVFWQQWSRKDEQLRKFTHIGLVVTFIVAVIIALVSDTIINIWYQLGSIATPALLLPLLSSFYPRWKMRPKFAVVNLIGAGGLALSWVIVELIKGQKLFGVEAVFPGLIFSAGVFVWDRIRQWEA